MKLVIRRKKRKTEAVRRKRYRNKEERGGEGGTRREIKAETGEEIGDNTSGWGRGIEVRRAG